MKLLKKTILLLTIFTVFLGQAFADGKRIAIFNPSTEGLSEEEITWLPSSVRRKLEANFNDYTNYQIVEIQNEGEIKELQKKAESSAYDEKSSIELGKLLSAEYAVFATITKTTSNNQSKYILSANITNLTTGIRLSSAAIDSVSETANLFEGAGCSVNLLTVKFCADLGINLSAIDKYILLKGDDITDTEQIQLTEDELKKYNAKIKELDSRLKEVSVSADLDAETKRAKLEAEKALMEQQEAIARDRLERLKKQQEQLMQDQKDQLLRSAAQREKIEKVAKEAEEKAASLRSKNLANLSVDQQIAIIEAKKQALVDIRAGVNAQKNFIKQNAQEEYNIRAKAIDEEPLRKGEMDSNGNMLQDVKVKRINEKRAIKGELEAAARQEIEKLGNSISQQEQTLLKDIEKDRNTLKQQRTISSLQDSRIFFVGKYAGEKYHWDGTASFYLSDYCIFSQNIGIDYKAVSGKMPARATDEDAKWDDYLDTVDLYDYMFRRQVPVITLEMDYIIEAMDDSHPSMYKVSLLTFRVVDIRTGKTIQTIKPLKSAYTFTVKPQVDIRTPEDINVTVNTKASNKSSSKKTTETTVKNVNQKPAKKIKTKDPTFDQKKGGGKRFNMGGNIGYMIQADNMSELEYPVFGYLYATLPLSSCIFTGLDVGFTPVPHNFGNYKSTGDGILFCDFDIGVNLRARLGNWYPDLYAGAALGFGFADHLYKSGTYKDARVFHYRLYTGIDFPVTDNLCLTTEIDISSVEHAGTTCAVLIGTAFTLPD